MTWRAGRTLAVGMLVGAAGLTAPAWAAAEGPIVKGKLDLKEVELLQLPRLDVQQLTIEDQLRATQGEAPRFAVPIEVHMTPDTDGTWEDLGNDMWLWRLTIRSPEATSINFGFIDYHMPKGATLDLYAQDGERQYRSFTSADNYDHGQLWTPPVKGDTVTIQLVVPGNQLENYRLVLGSINVGYRGFGSGIVARSGSCNLDVVCSASDGYPDVDLWRDEISSSAVISTGGSTFCSGFMVNNTSQDRTPHFMTANHCGINAGNAASLVTFWNYENSTCRPVGSPASGGAGDGSLAQFITGSTFRAAGSTSDFTLVTLSSAPPQAWEISFSGWDATGVDAASAVGIHHPNTDEKRISFEDAPTTTTTYLQTAVPGNGSHVRIADWDIGTTEPGSSGSCLYDEATHRVIGQLHGGFAACGNDDSDWYGKFSVSYPSLATWLDPGSTGALFVNTLPGAGFSVTPGTDTLHEGVVGGPFNNDPVVYTLQNNSPASLNYEVRIVPGGTFDLLINGGTTPVSGSLGASGGSTNVTASLGGSVTGLSAGTYTTSLEFEDQTNGQTFTRVHTLEVGATGFTVTPAIDLASGGPVGGPFSGSQVYTITSTKPTSVTVQVAQSQNWVSVDGFTTAQNYVLPSQGSSVNVTIAYDAANAGLLPAGFYTESVSFTNQSGGTGDTSRGVVLDVGRYLYPSTDTPITISDNSSFQSVITVSDDFCVGDVDVDMDVTHTYIGDLRIILTNPSGISVTLHDRTGGSADNIVTTYDDEGADPPDLPALSDFDNLGSMGNWVLTVSDNAGGDVGSLNSWTLRLASLPGACPTRQDFATYPLDTDEGWTGTGQWAWGVPAGAGGDPSAGFTGSNVWGYNLGGAYPNNMGVEALTSSAIDCSGKTGVRVAFYRWLGVESATFDHASFQVSNDGTNFTTIWDHTGGTLNESAWGLQSYDISAVADNQSTVFLRWTMGTTDGSVTFEGWNLDDISLSSLVLAPACSGDADGDGDTDLSDLNLVLFNFGTAQPAGTNGDVDGDGDVDLTDLNTVLFDFGCA